MDSLRSSEYDAKYQEFDVATYGGSGRRLNQKSIPNKPVAEITLSYESTYDVMTRNAKTNSRKKSIVAEHAAHSAAVRTNKRRMSVAVAEAAAAARDIAEEKEDAAPVTEMHPELTRRFSMIANEAAAAAAEKVPTKAAKEQNNGSIQLGSSTQWSTKSWGTTYNSGYQAPMYLKKMAKVAEQAAIAAIEFKRETGLCSEYLASYEEFEAADMVSPHTIYKPEDQNQVGSCLDFTEADEMNTKPSTHTFIPRRVAWSSEYAQSFSSDMIDETQGTVDTQARDAALSNANGNAVMDCMDWVAPEPSPAPVVDESSSVFEPTGKSMYSNDFTKPNKYEIQAAFLPSAVTEISACMDWEGANASRINAAKARASNNLDTKTNADEWVLVEAPIKRSNNAVIPGWGSVKSKEQMVTTYDWDFDGAWKKFQPKRNQKTKATKLNYNTAAKQRQAKIKALATQKGVSKQSANELYVASKVLSTFATGSEYQKRYSVPAAVRSAAVNKVIVQQKNIASKIKKINRPSTENNPILRGKNLNMNNMINMTSYQSSFGSSRQPSMKARIRALAAADKQA